MNNHNENRDELDAMTKQNISVFVSCFDHLIDMQIEWNKFFANSLGDNFETNK